MFYFDRMQYILRMYQVLTPYVEQKVKKSSFNTEQLHHNVQGQIGDLSPMEQKIAITWCQNGVYFNNIIYFISIPSFNARS